MTASQISIIQSLVGDQQKALIALGEDLKLTYEETSAKKETEWETLWQVAFKEGKKQGINEFLQKLDNPE